MDSASQALLIVVSAVLAIFLIFSTVAVIYVIRVLKRAEQMAGSVESAANAVKRGAEAAPIIKIISKLISRNRKD